MPLSTIDFTRPTAAPRAKLFRIAAMAGLVGYTVLLAYLSLVPVVPSASEVSDKILHFVAYGGLTALTAAALPKVRLTSLFISLSLVGLALEIAQGIMDKGRMASFGDQIANMGGILLALLIWIFLAWLRNVFSKP